MYVRHSQVAPPTSNTLQHSDGCWTAASLCRQVAPPTGTPPTYSPQHTEMGGGDEWDCVVHYWVLVAPSTRRCTPPRGVRGRTCPALRGASCWWTWRASRWSPAGLRAGGGPRGTSPHSSTLQQHRRMSTGPQPQCPQPQCPQPQWLQPVSTTTVITCPQPVSTTTVITCPQPQCPQPQWLHVHNNSEYLSTTTRTWIMCLQPRGLWMHVHNHKWLHVHNHKICYYISTSTVMTGPKTTSTVMTGPKTTITVMTGPKTTGTVMTGPKTTSTVMTGPKTTGTVMTGPKTTSTVMTGPKTTSTVQCL